MNKPGNSEEQALTFPDSIPHAGEGSASAMAAMLRKRRQAPAEPAPLLDEPPGEGQGAARPA